MKEVFTHSCVPRMVELLVSEAGGVAGPTLLPDERIVASRGPSTEG